MIRSRYLAGVAVIVLLAAPSASWAQNVPQLLQGLMTGNQSQDQGLRDAYERGYQKGRQDEAQLSRRGRQEDRRQDDRRMEDNGRQQYDRNGNPYSR